LLQHGNIKLHCEKTANICLTLLTVHTEQFSSSAVTCLQLRRTKHAHTLFKSLSTLQDGMPLKLYRMYNLVWSIKRNVVNKLQDDNLQGKHNSLSIQRYARMRTTQIWDIARCDSCATPIKIRRAV
jgi:hypothetical protein